MRDTNSGNTVRERLRPLTSAASRAGLPDSTIIDELEKAAKRARLDGPESVPEIPVNPPLVMIREELAADAAQTVSNAVDRLFQRIGGDLGANGLADRVIMATRAAVATGNGELLAELEENIPWLMTYHQVASSREAVDTMIDIAKTAADMALRAATTIAAGVFTR